MKIRPPMAFLVYKYSSGLQFKELKQNVFCHFLCPFAHYHPLGLRVPEFNHCDLQITFCFTKLTTELHLLVNTQYFCDEF